MKLNPENVDTIVVHTSATKADQDIGAHEIDEWHRDPKKHPPNGWSMIGYHAVIRRNGAVEGGRPLDTVGAHVFGHNLHTVSVCMVGGLDANGKPEDNYTPEQYRALGMLLKNWRMVFHNVKDVCGHRDLSPDIDGDGVIEPFEWIKDCPCFDVRAWRLRELPDLFDNGGLRGPDNDIT